MRRPITTEQFITKSREIHGDVYSYDKVIYKNNSTDVVITCKMHGDFAQRPSHHTSGGHGCRECGSLSMTEKSKKPRYNQKVFIEKSKKVHGDRYSYDNSIYTKAVNKIEIICKDHGSFWQAPTEHIKGQGCPKCWFSILRKQNRKNLITKDIFLEKAKEAHPDILYDYSKVICDGVMKKIIIGCPTHGDFEQRLNTHLSGFGCRICGNSINLKEKKLLDRLKNEFPTENIQSQISPTWLGRQSFDIFIPKLNIAIEYQGEQHLKPITWFGGDAHFRKTLERDSRKYQLSMKNNIELIYFSFDTYKDESLSILPICHNIENLITYIFTKFAQFG